MNKLNTAERTQIIRCLVEGSSINSTCRICGRSKLAVLRLLCEVGEACQKYHDRHVRGIACGRLQLDEIWNYCYAKQKNVPADKQNQLGYGDVWTWTAVDADTKLIVSYHVGLRNGWHAQEFVDDIRDRVINNPQITSDGHLPYLKAIANAFGPEIDYAQLVKIYGPDSNRSPEARYSPPVVVSCTATPISGNPDPAYISTSFVERSNLTMRMSMRRFTRLTNAFSKKLDNMKHAVALNFMYFNYCRIHQTLRVTPAIEAELTDHVWEIEELIALLN